MINHTVRSSVIREATYGPASIQPLIDRNPNSKYFSKGHGEPLNLNNRRSAPNVFTMCICKQWGLWNRIGSMGGLHSVCAVNRYAKTPYLWMPPEGQRLNKINSIALPTDPAQEGVELTVVSFQVPPGYDGVIINPVNQYTGSGFFEGSGDLIWRIKLNRRYVKDYGNIQTSLGSLTLPMSSQQHTIRLESNQIVTYTVTLAAGALGRLNGGRIICAIIGWTYPQN